MDNTTRRRRTKSGEAAPPPTSPQDKGKKRYNLRSRKNLKNDVRWVDDDTLKIEDEDEDDSTYAPSEDEHEENNNVRNIHGITLPKDVPVTVKIHIHSHQEESDEEDEDEDDDDEDEYEDEDEDEYDEEEEEEEEPLTEDEVAILLARSLGYNMGKRDRQQLLILDSKKKVEKKDSPPIYLSKKEREYFEDLPKAKSKKALTSMKSIKEIIGETETPLKFKVLDMDITDDIKAILIRKIDTMTKMGPESGESQKLRVWVEALMRVPFGKTVPLPVTISDGPEKCGDFLKNARAKLDKATYGMEPAKMQIMQTVAQWISNPSSVGNCIAMSGPAGTGKTSFARNGIASVLNRPFMFFSLGGASDIAHYIGHSYTYEGSTWGRIIDSIIQSKCMNPVLYFDELDKISGTPHGEEIASMLIHLTDRSQNSQYHDRYFAGVDFDLSKCLFVFSYNDESKINPILKDRMTIIRCSGYKDPEKKIIIANYVWKDILERVGISRDDLTASEEAADYIIREFSNGEEGMRSLIRIVEAIVFRINLLRISDKETAEKYKFYMPIQFPMKLDVPAVKKLLTDYAPKEIENWRLMYN
jgi:ATP-dependent Lon protease